MSHDYKGALVTVAVSNEFGTPVKEEVVMLDTDTMIDYFEAFDPRTHNFIITPEPNPDEE